MAINHGYFHVLTAKIKPTTNRSGSSKNLHVLAPYLHLLAGYFPSRPGGLLGMEQHSVYGPTMADYAQNGDYWKASAAIRLRFTGTAS